MVSDRSTRLNLTPVPPKDHIGVGGGTVSLPRKHVLLLFLSLHFLHLHAPAHFLNQSIFFSCFLLHLTYDVSIPQYIFTLRILLLFLLVGKRSSSLITRFSRSLYVQMFNLSRSNICTSHYYTRTFPVLLLTSTLTWPRREK